MSSEQTPTEYLESTFDALWERYGNEYLGWHDEEIRIFQMLPHDPITGMLPESYTSPGNMISLRGDESVSYGGVHNYAAGPDANEWDEPAHPQEELIIL